MTEQQNSSKPFEGRLGGGQMFDSIAKRYDGLNRVLSLGMDGRWRKKMVQSLVFEEGREILDLATGTADVAIAISKHRPGTKVVGLDPSTQMLEVGQQKLVENTLDADIELVVGDAQDLPFEDNRFSSTTISFGLRNVPDRRLCVHEMARVTQPGGTVAILELSEPTKGPLKGLAKGWIHSAVPKIGAWVSSDPAYAYLAKSIAAFPPPDVVMQWMRDAGLNNVEAKGMSFGAVQLFTGTAT